MVGNYTRSIAKRVFAHELGETSLSFKDGDDQYSPTYAITPTGEKVNRIFMVATLLEAEDIGKDSEYWRGRIADPTGTMHVYAGQYQPAAAQFLVEAEVPAFVAIIGKPSTYQTPEGHTKSSIRPEAIFEVDAETQNKWIMETAAATIERLKTLNADDEVKAKAREHYKVDIGAYNTMVRIALKSIEI